MEFNKINWPPVGADLSCPSPIYRPSWMFRSSMTTREEPAHPAQRSSERIEHRPQCRVTPDVPGLPQLDMRVYARLKGLYLPIHLKMRCQCCQHMLPYPLLRGRAKQAKPQFIERIIGTGQGLDLADDATIL